MVRLGAQGAGPSSASISLHHALRRRHELHDEHAGEHQRAADEQAPRDGVHAGHDARERGEHALEAEQDRRMRRGRVALRPALDEEGIDRAADRRPCDRRPHLPGQVQADVDDERGDDDQRRCRDGHLRERQRRGPHLGSEEPGSHDVERVEERPEQGDGVAPAQREVALQRERRQTDGRDDRRR